MNCQRQAPPIFLAKEKLLPVSSLVRAAGFLCMYQVPQSRENSTGTAPVGSSQSGPSSGDAALQRALQEASGDTCRLRGPGLGWLDPLQKIELQFRGRQFIPI